MSISSLYLPIRILYNSREGIRPERFVERKDTPPHMNVFLSTLGQMAQLAFFILIGYILVRVKILPAEGTTLLSRMENWIFIPALILGTFMQNFTTDRLSTAWQYVAAGSAVAIGGMLIALLVSPLCTRDSYLCKLYTYGLTFSNFGFMGNSIILALYPTLFPDYLVFSVPLWILIYSWGVPVLLIPAEKANRSLATRLIPFLNPMFAAMILGIILGLTRVPVPAFITSACDSLGSCMSPVAMVLTGMTMAKYDLGAVIRKGSIYAVSALRLLVIPLLSIAALHFLNIPKELGICIICGVAMPLGLNTVVIPGAYGRDTSVPAGMALISHILSVATIPLMFMLFDLLV